VIVFDLDGCLIDSENMIRRAYREAGVRAPADFLSLGHHDWIAPGDRERVHARKNAAYLRLLAAGPVRWLPAYTAAQYLSCQGNTLALLTGAPEEAVRYLSEHGHSWPFTVSCAGVTPQAKSEWLASHGAGVYVDDQDYVAIPAKWRFVHYTGQDAGVLHRQVTR
jgi:phosphoglycolate phosphatase-like HAD superfamily hydrolase